MKENYQGRVLLAVLAHPDDESFGMGGTLALYAERGAEVHLVCATRGEMGEVGPDHLKGYQSIGQLREAELMCAANHLGLKEVHFLPYRDSGMQGSEANQHPDALINAPLDQVAARVQEIIHAVKAEVVLTFDPIGGYYHPDHIYMHKAAARAFNSALENHRQDPQAAYQPSYLYYHTISKRFLRLNVRLLRLLGKDPTRWGKNKDIDLTKLAAEDFPVDVVIDYRSVEDRKNAAAACHASQIGSSLSSGFLRRLYRLFGVGPRDLFMQAFPEERADQIKHDLFS